MVLSENNYYSTEANREFCSASQYKSFMGTPYLPGCEACTMAQINGIWVPEKTKALMIGSIVDALVEGCKSEELLERFPECVSTRGATKGELKSEYKQAFTLYSRLLNDALAMKYLNGQKQVIMIGEIEGLPFKIKMDSYFDGLCIVDLKTTADLEKFYYAPQIGQHLSFVMAYGYDTQLAIYQEIVRQNTGKKLPCYIVAVDKKDHPTIRILNIENKILDEALTQVKQNCWHIISIKSGEIPPEQYLRCEVCDYCRDTYQAKVLSLTEYANNDDGQ